MFIAADVRRRKWDKEVSLADRYWGVWDGGDLR